MTDRNYYARAIKVAWPSVLESFFLALAGMIDTFMVSALGPASIAAVGLTTQPKFIGLSFFTAISMGVSALVARRKGQDNKNSANRILITALTVSMILTVIVTVVFLAFGNQFLIWAGSNHETHSLAHSYYNVIIGFAVFNIISMVINAAQRGSGNTKIAFTTNLVSTLVNISFNYLLIEGRHGFPKLGVQGAAIATVIGTVVASLMSIRSLFKEESFVNVKYIVENNIKPTIGALRNITSLSSNLLVENLAMRIGFLTTSVMAANLGTGQFAAHNVGMQMLSISFAFADGMQVAAISLSGQALGAGQPDEAIKLGYICQRIGFTIGLFIAAFFLLFGRPLYGIFFTDPVIIDYGVVILRFIIAIVFLQISQVVFGGVLRSAGDTKYTLRVALLSVTVIRSAVTLVLVRIFDLGLLGIWIGVLCDQGTRFVLNTLRFRSKKWIGIEI